MSWRPNFNRTRCSDDVKTVRAPDLQKTKSVFVDKTGKVEVHITDNQSWNSCRKVVADREFTFGSAIDLQGKNAMYFDCALIHGLSLIHI